MFLGMILIMSVRILARNKWHTQTRNLQNKSQKLSRVKGNQPEGVQHSGEVTVGSGYHLEVKEAKEERYGKTAWQLHGEGCLMGAET